MTYFAAVMLIQGTVFMCKTSFSLISPLPVNLVTTFHQYRHDLLYRVIAVYLLIILGVWYLQFNVYDYGIGTGTVI